MPNSLLVLLVVALVVLSERKRTTTQTGGADKAIVALLFVVLAGGGFAVAYALNDDVKDWVQGIFDMDNGNLSQPSPCSTYKSLEDCPSLSCEWDGGTNTCNDKNPGNQGNHGNEGGGRPTETSPINNCTSPSPLYIYNQLTSKQGSCGISKVSQFKFSGGPPVNYKITCDGGVNKITSTSTSNEIEVNDNLLTDVLDDFVCLNKIPSAKKLFLRHGPSMNYVNVDQCRNLYGNVWGLVLNTPKHFKSRETFLITDGISGSDAYGLFKFTPVNQTDTNDYLQTNVYYTVDLTGESGTGVEPFRGKWTLESNPDHYAIKNRYSHTNIRAAGSPDNALSFHIMFKRHGNNSSEKEPLFFEYKYDVYHRTKDKGNNPAAGGIVDATRGETGKMRVWIQPNAACGASSSFFVAHFDDLTEGDPTTDEYANEEHNYVQLQADPSLS